MFWCGCYGRRAQVPSFLPELSWKLLIRIKAYLVFLSGSYSQLFNYFPMCFFNCNLHSSNIWTFSSHLSSCFSYFLLWKLSFGPVSFSHWKPVSNVITMSCTTKLKTNRPRQTERKDAIRSKQGRRVNILCSPTQQKNISREKSGNGKTNGKWEFMSIIYKYRFDTTTFSPRLIARCQYTRTTIIDNTQIFKTQSERRVQAAADNSWQPVSRGRKSLW